MALVNGHSGFILTCFAQTARTFPAGKFHVELTGEFEADASVWRGDRRYIFREDSLHLRFNHGVGRVDEDQVEGAVAGIEGVHFLSEDLPGIGLI